MKSESHVFEADKPIAMIPQTNRMTLTSRIKSYRVYLLNLKNGLKKDLILGSLPNGGLAP